uniref:Uncharacterized protein n=1 Tax=Glossina brevipalpis TaxID=37001 RepID=A0A1A9W630_9MUSC
MLILKLWYNGSDNVATINMTTNGNAFVTVTTTTGNNAKFLSPAAAFCTVDTTSIAFVTFNESMAPAVDQALPTVDEQS